MLLYDRDCTLINKKGYYKIVKSINRKKLLILIKILVCDIMNTDEEIS